MLHLQRESCHWWQNAGAAMQAHVSPSLLKALAGNKQNPSLFLGKSCIVHSLWSNCLSCRTRITLALYAGMSYRRMIRSTRAGKRGRKRLRRRGKAQRMLSVEANICTFRIYSGTPFVFYYFFYVLVSLLANFIHHNEIQKVSLWI